MNRLYRKSEILFSIAAIIIYVVITSVADNISKLLTFVVHLLMLTFLLLWLRKNKLFSKYGICKPQQNAKKLLFYIPLIIISSVNFWFGLKLNMPVLETVFYVGSMICVGFLEEIIFRGLLFKAMAKDNIKSAIVVSSLTFGIGHIVNLVNSSGVSLISNLCQVFYAVAFGFLFVVIFIKTKSLIPCIISHAIINSMSAFLNKEVLSGGLEIFVSILLFAVAVSYALFLLKALPSEYKNK